MGDALVESLHNCVYVSVLKLVQNAGGGKDGIKSALLRAMVSYHNCEVQRK